MQTITSHLAAALLLAVFVLTGCKTVDTLNPIGDPVTEDLAEQLDGTWTFREGVVMLKWQGDGQLDIAALAEQEGQLQTLKLSGLITSVGDRYFLQLRQVKDDAQAEDGPMSFAAITMTDDALVLMNPIPLAFARAVDQGELEGTVEKSHDAGGKITAVRTHLTADSQALANYILTREGVGPFDWQSPTVITRIRKPSAEQ